jgi:branched-chain amino acid transport system ATP-binding protein
LGLIGPNGAGKTTVFNLLSGIHKPTKGKVVFKGENITGLKPNKAASKGIVRTFQATNLFQEMTALENVLVAHHIHIRSGLYGVLFNTAFARRGEKEIQQRAIEILESMGLGSVKDESAKNLPHGHQRALGISMALAADPELLLLDEPVTGMNPEETMSMMKIIERIRDRGKTLLVVEHDMKAIMGISDRLIVLNFGKKIAEGLPEEIKKNRDVIEAYLGSGEE